MASSARKPNVILLITDDQGYGDLSCHGNPTLRTPHMDRLYEESIRFSQFHVAPVCTPTRSQIMTGQDALRNGAYSWAYGHECIFSELPIMPEFFRRNGYRTGHFGKWHLGDNFPYRPHDRGFDESIHHKGAAINQTPNWWNSDNFDDVFWDRDEPKPFPGYSTDVWFDQSMQFIDRALADEVPFFLYLPTNCPHSPLYVRDHYRTPYRHLGNRIASFFGMIVNIDENLARLDSFLGLRGIRENTILIFMTDNGGTVGVPHFNAGMRGKKGSLYDGGHRVPFFIRWPAADWIGGREIDVLAQAQDILPTLIGACKLVVDSTKLELDGVDLAPAIEGETAAQRNRRVVVQFTTRPPMPAKGDACVLSGPWRLVNGRELYNVRDDPAQEQDVADAHPNVVTELQDHYEQWWVTVQETIRRVNYIPIGDSQAPTVDLCLFDWDDHEGEGNNAEQMTIREGANIQGAWHVEVSQAGTYRFELRRWPREARVAIAGASPEFVGPDCVFERGVALPIKHATLRINGVERTVPVRSEDECVTVDLELRSGHHDLDTAFLDEAGESLCGAYYVTVSRK